MVKYCAHSIKVLNTILQLVLSLLIISFLTIYLTVYYCYSRPPSSKAKIVGRPQVLAFIAKSIMPATRTVRGIRRRSINHYQYRPSPANEAIETTKYCPICTDDVLNRDFPSKPLTSDCSHESGGCKKCTTHWLVANINAGYEYLDCMECGIELQHHEVRRALSEADLEAFDQRLLKKLLADSPDFQWCLSIRCSSGQFHCGHPLFECDVCKYRSCISCGIPWHEGLTCEAFQEGKSQTQEYRDNQKMLDETTKPCPKCKAPLQKNGPGCDQLICARCGTGMCWICGNEMSRHSHEHKSECLYSPHRFRTTTVARPFENALDSLISGLDDPNDSSDEGLDEKDSKGEDGESEDEDDSYGSDFLYDEDDGNYGDDSDDSVDEGDGPVYQSTGANEGPMDIDE